MESPKVETKTRASEGKYKNELRRAWNMITCSPKDPTGYLIAGHCYKDHGKQEKAIKVFNMGLNQVSTKHKEYEALRQGKQEAESRKNCRMDILGQLPLDIIHYIFDNYFDQDSITPYSRICSTWRNIVLDYSKFWKRISFGNRRSKNDMVSPHHMLLPSICQHVQEIEIICNSPLETLFELFRTIKFSKMRSLKIIQDRTVDFEGPISYAKLPSVLNVFSKTLTTLDLELRSESTDLPTLSDILNICNNLTKLRYVVNSHYQVLMPITITKQHKTLLLKELICSSTSIQKHGQSIHELYVNHDQAPHYVLSFKTESNDDDNITVNNNSLGLEHIEVSGITSPNSLLQLIKSHRLTLSYLSITLFGNTSSNDNDWRKWADVLHLFPLTNLIGLNLCTYDMDTVDDSTICKYILPAIIRIINNDNSANNQQTPNLQNFKLYSQGMIPNNVLDAITKMPKITTLILVGCSFDPDKMHDVVKIFERRSNNSNAILTATTLASSTSSLLTNLQFEYVNGMNDHIVFTASKIKSLTHLTMNGLYCNDYTVFKTLAQNISQLPLLEWLRLCYFNIQRDDLKILATSKSLHYIDLYRIDDEFSQDELDQIAKISSNDLVIRDVLF
ncbi:hypothetical protein INT45_006245 [Circinella minor]|uniref:F-box domain-containing protein n=1 Tax=Circinella minor TaxID=1195481 RepID=A0A8H7RVL0_9FUNG|nr:hypothetical protein INT45_006245 [Circinella minor]